jgi:PAS domain-containing protein
MPVGLVAVDTDGRVAVFNDTAEKLFGTSIGRGDRQARGGNPARPVPRDLERPRPGAPIVEREFECTIRELTRCP